MKHCIPFGMLQSSLCVCACVREFYRPAHREAQKWKQAKNCCRSGDWRQRAFSGIVARTDTQEGKVQLLAKVTEFRSLLSAKEGERQQLSLLEVSVTPRRRLIIFSAVDHRRLLHFLARSPDSQFSLDVGSSKL